MGGEKLHSEADLGELSEELKGGIETCRSVIANYRSLLIDERAAVEHCDENVADDLQQRRSGQQPK